MIIAENIIISLCAHLTGSLLPTASRLSLNQVKFFDLICLTSLTNQQIKAQQKHHHTAQEST